jgi:DNA-binding GntR family transcriptional regulator
VSRRTRDAEGLSAATQPATSGLAEHVYLLLKADVINDQFAAGDRIVIESVAIRLGVSPTPVREALARLAGEQLVAFRAYVGYSVLPPLSVSELRDLFEAREVIECAGAVRACERSTDADLASLRMIDARIRAGHYGKDRYSEFVSFVNDNQRFHETLLDAARNPELRRAFDALNYEARIARRTRGRGIPDLGLICEEHAAIIAALAARDADALVAAVTDHARESHQRLVDDLARVPAVS